MRRPRTYGFKGGDLLGIVEHLDYLADLGINALYLTPIFASASNHRYHTYDYYSVDPLLGGDAALRELLDAAPRARHARRARRCLQPLGPWLLAVPPRRREPAPGRPTSTGSTSIASALESGVGLRPYPAREEERAMAEALGRASATAMPDPAPPGLPRLVGPARTAQAQHRQPAPARAPARGGRALAALRHRRLAARRGGGDRCRLLARVSRALPGPSVMTRTSWPRSGASNRHG